jgi:hypothetical protein
MDHFTSTDTLNASNFLREVAQPDGSAVLHFLMPVTGFDYNGQPVHHDGLHGGDGRGHRLMYRRWATRRRKSRTGRGGRR